MFDSILLFQKEPKSTAKLITQYPAKIEIPDLPLLKNLCVPYSISKTKAEIFAINTPSNYCFIYSFIFEKIPYSIIIMTSSLYASLYFDFLHAVDASFATIQEKSDPMCRFGLVKSLLLSWFTKTADELVVNFPLDSFSLNISSITSWFANFNVAPFALYINEVWHAILMNKGVLIIAPNAEIASSAVFGVLSLLDRFKYCDEFLLYTEKGDPRYHEIMTNDSLPYKIVGTTNPDLANGDSRFSAIITIKATTFENMFEQQQEYRTKTIRLFGCLFVQMNIQLLTDPYSDLLNKKLNINELVRLSDNEYSAEIFTEIQNTKTFLQWRKHVSERNQLRESFLSVPPYEAIKQIHPEFYQKALDQLLIIVNSNVRDLHLQRVLKTHQAILSKKVKKLDEDRNESSDFI